MSQPIENTIVEEYINKLTAIKNDYIKEKIQNQTNNIEMMRSSIEALRERFASAIQK